MKVWISSIVVPIPRYQLWSKYVDQELRLQLDRLESTLPSSPPLGPVIGVVALHAQLQLDLAKPALSAPVAALQLDRLQLDRE